ncbi:MAG: type I restriction endonuclease [Chloroflexota bacterium]
MDFVDTLNQLASRIKRQKDSVLTEEAAKTAFILPFIQALGYDVFNPSEVIPELTADHGVKKGEKVDYAIRLDDRIVILVECKPIGAALEAKHAGQLYRYFSVTDARFGVLTDGIRYLFYSDLEKENRMDDRPFFEFNLFQFENGQVEELKKFTRPSFDLDTIISTASNLKYHRAIVAEIKSEFDSPSEDLIKLLTNRVYSGRFTQQIKEQFTALTEQALKEFIRGQVNKRLKTALDTDKANLAEPDASPDATDEQSEDNNGIVTTPEEWEAYRIIQAIGAEIADPSRITLRDAKSYCAILWDDNNRRPICRLHFGKTRNTVTIFGPENETKVELEKIVDLYQHKERLHAAIQQYVLEVAI